MSVKKCAPDFVLESSWEVCNKMGGIYTVLSTRAKTLGNLVGGNLLFIGPDLWHDQENPLFSEDPELLARMGGNYGCRRSVPAHRTVEYPR